MSFLSRRKKSGSARARVLAQAPQLKDLTDGQTVRAIIEDPRDRETTWGVFIGRQGTGTVITLPLEGVRSGDEAAALHACNNYNALDGPLALFIDSDSWEEPTFVLRSSTVVRLDDELTWAQLELHLDTLASEAAKVMAALEPLLAK